MRQSHSSVSRCAYVECVGFTTIMVPLMHLLWTTTMKALQAQHIKDLRIYRAAHQECRNRLIHHVMIPVECFSFQLLLRLLAGNSINKWVAWTLAILSITVASQLSAGLYSFMFHTASAWLSNWIVTSHETKTAFLIGTLCWTLAWAVQVGIGHYLFEKNSPNVANISEVSYLAMGLSVLIAWSSWNTTGATWTGQCEFCNFFRQHQAMFLAIPPLVDVRNRFVKQI